MNKQLVISASGISTCHSTCFPPASFVNCLSSHF